MADLGTAELMALAWSLGWRIAAGIIIGYYADQWLGSSPWLTLALSLAALVSAVRQMLVVLAEHRESKPASDE
jgi:F0F1-type ATP synthase assembly protein I